MTATRYSQSTKQMRRKIETTATELRELLATGGMVVGIRLKLQALLQRLEEAAR